MTRTKLPTISMQTFVTCICLFMACVSCNRPKTDVSNNGSPTNDTSVQILPRSRITISGADNAGGGQHPILESVYGGHDATFPGEQEIGLMHLLIIAPKGESSFRRTDTGPNTMRFEWGPWGGQSMLLSILYDPEAHDIAILDKHYLLQNGNFFVITVTNTSNIRVRQLPDKKFDYITPRDALRTFKRQCKDLSQVQEM
jgi:hypothetical protein